MASLLMYFIIVAGGGMGWVGVGRGGLGWGGVNTIFTLSLMFFGSVLVNSLRYK